MSGPAPSSTTPASIWGPRLARVLERQRDVCLTLEALSRRQEALVAGEDTDALLALLGERQTAVDELTALGAELEPLKSVWESEAWRLPPDQRSRITALVEEIGRLVETVGRRDEAARVRLEERRAVVARELGDISRARGADAAYAGAGRRESPPAYEDRKG